MLSEALSDETMKYLEEKHITTLLEELFHDVLVHLPDNPLDYLLKSLDSKTKPRVFIVGPSGSGKRTQARRIAEKYGALHINVDEVFQNEAQCDTAAGKVIAQCMQSGNVVPDAVAAELIVRRLQEDDLASRGYVLDGFPRTRAQALYLQAANLTPNLFVMLDVPKDIAVQRCANRWYDPSTKITYNTESDPPPSGMHVERIHEDDISTAAVVARWKYFDARRNELIECYEHFVVCINGNRTQDVVLEEICEQVDARCVLV